jgi:hypothetical protein
MEPIFFFWAGLNGKIPRAGPLFTDQCVVPVLARGTTTIHEDGVRQLMPPFVHAVIVSHDYHETDIRR